MNISAILKIKALGAIALSTVLGYSLGKTYASTPPEDHLELQQHLLSYSHEQIFHYSATVALMWLLLCVAVVGRTPRPVSGRRALFMYGPFSFAYGFAAEFFGRLISFTVAIGGAAEQLRAYGIAVFAWLTLLIAVPVILSFEGIGTENEGQVKRVTAIAALVVIAWSIYGRL